MLLLLLLFNPFIMQATIFDLTHALREFKQHKEFHEKKWKSERMKQH
jgi:hypothetical protein